MRAWVVLATVVACGRFAFDERADAPGGGLGSDGGGSDSGAVGFCAGVTPAPTFCDDFDGGLPIGSGWTDNFAQVGGAVATSSAQAKSPPSAFESTVATQGSGIGAACLEYSLPLTHQLHYAYDLFLVSRPPSGYVEIGSVNFNTGVGSFYTDLYLRTAGSDTYHEELSPAGSGAFMSGDVAFPPLGAGVWHHIDMQLDLDAKAYTFSIDGTTIANPTRFAVSAAPIIVQAGINFLVQPQAWDVYVDNVVIDAQ